MNVKTFEVWRVAFLRRLCNRRVSRQPRLNIDPNDLLRHRILRMLMHISPFPAENGRQNALIVRSVAAPITRGNDFGSDP